MNHTATETQNPIAACKVSPGPCFAIENLRRLIQNANLHFSVSESVKMPPRSGPATAATYLSQL